MANKKQPRDPEHAQKYPECTKLARAGDRRREILAFLEWLRAEKKIELGSMEIGFRGYIEPIDPGLDGYDGLVLEYLEIDSTKLEEERRAMLTVLQEAAVR